MFEGTKAGEIRSFTSLPEQKLCWIPPGTFRLGSPTTEETREDHEFQEDVMLGHGFWMAQTETTQAQWLAIMDSLPEAMIGQAPAGPSYPVTNVTWHEASKYCERLTDRERVAGRIEHDMMFLLPTEAQWEYAYRSGSTTAFYWGDSIESLDLHAWFHDNTTKVGEPHAHEVGLKQSNQWGLLDMAGNVKEWCSDLYADRRHLYDSSEFPEVLQIRNAKGGSWAFKSPQKFRAAMRDGGLPDDPSDDIGFRVILVRSYPSE